MNTIEKVGAVISLMEEEKEEFHGEHLSLWREIYSALCSSAELPPTQQTTQGVCSRPPDRSTSNINCVYRDFLDQRQARNL